MASLESGLKVGWHRPQIEMIEQAVSALGNPGLCINTQNRDELTIL